MDKAHLSASKTTKTLDFNELDAATGNIYEAIAQISRLRSKAGAQQNRLAAQSTLNTTMNTVTTTALSKVADADLAAETTSLATAKMLASSATAMLAQANTSKEIVSYLLKKYIG